MRRNQREMPDLSFCFVFSINKISVPAHFCLGGRVVMVLVLMVGWYESPGFPDISSG